MARGLCFGSWCTWLPFKGSKSPVKKKQSRIIPGIRIKSADPRLWILVCRFYFVCLFFDKWFLFPHLSLPACLLIFSFLRITGSSSMVTSAILHILRHSMHGPWALKSFGRADCSLATSFSAVDINFFLMTSILHFQAYRSSPFPG